VLTLTEDSQGLRSVSIAASVLTCFSSHAELGATQVARELGVAKSTACRMLSALIELQQQVREMVQLGVMVCTGLLGHATNYVEHPELIADGICQYAGIVGRENVIASADCGSSSRASFAPEVHPTVVWAKFAALSQGAAIATKRLWS
jgi:methionine synthase II (cobalamin-independent)